MLILHLQFRLHKEINSLKYLKIFKGDIMANPALNDKIWNRMGAITDESKMTIEGTINKSGILILITMIGAFVGWNLHSSLLMIAGVVFTLVLSLVMIFKPHTAVYLSQPYALIEGILLGSISSLYSVLYPGIVSNALLGTVSCFVVMLAMYRFKIIRVNEKFRNVIIAATFAIGITYLINMIMGFFGSEIPMIHQSSPLGIAFSVIVVGVAAFNLMLDFDMIENSFNQNAPKFMEWYCGFALLLTLVWLYLEILRLLSKLNKK